MSAHIIQRPRNAREIAAAKQALGALRDRAAVAIGGAAVPVSAVAVLEHALEALASGSGIAVLSLDAEITTQEAADLIGVSRPTLVKLVEAGAIPRLGVAGSHRRLKVANVLAYRAQREAMRQASLDAQVAENQRLGLYED